MSDSNPTSSPPEEAVLHPSLGQSGYLVSYFPLSLFDDPTKAATPPSEPLLVTVPPASMPLIFAHRQWRAGMLLADLIHLDIVDVRGLKVLELGAGTGLPGIMSALKQKVSGKSDEEEVEEKGVGGFTVITDYDEPSLVKTLKENVSRNLGEDYVSRSRSYHSGGVRVAGHCWAKAIDDLLDFLPSPKTLTLPSSQSSLFDLILLADCLWDPLSHSDLLKTITSTLSKTKDAKVVVISGLHTGRETLVSFMRRASRLGLKLKPLSINLKDQFTLSDEDSDSKVNERKELDEDDPLFKADETIVEVELSGQDELVANSRQNSRASLPDSDTPTKLSKNEILLAESSSSEQSESRHLFIEAHHHRLTGRRRKFVAEERAEERKEVGGVKQRNRWITVWTLAWKDEFCNDHH